MGLSQQTHCFFNSSHIVEANGDSLQRRKRELKVGPQRGDVRGDYTENARKPIAHAQRISGVRHASGMRDPGILAHLQRFA